jgi:hypothetical protein
LINRGRWFEYFGGGLAAGLSRPYNAAC